jgi:23S rRNA (cytosine1962-C5)-methyltransferase
LWKFREVRKIWREIILARPEPQAIWDKSLSEKQWSERLHSRFLIDIQNSNGEKGIWKN